jgi:hypothetical protein
MRRVFLFLTILILLFLNGFGKKNELSNRQSLDSTIVENIMKQCFTYDGNGNKTIEIKYIWSNNQWISSSKNEYTYDDNNDNIQNIEFHWRTGQWVFSFKRENTYDKNKKKTQSIDYIWRTDQWGISAKREYIYDTFGNNTHLANYRWHNNQWVLIDKTEYIYDSNNNEKQEVHYEDGEPIGKYEFTYDTNGNCRQVIIFNWSNGQWILSRKCDIDYDATNKTQEIYSGNDDKLTEKHEYTYNSMGNIIANINYKWNENLWVFSSKSEYIYDSNENNTQLIKYVWRNEKWINIIKQEFTYDLSHLLSDLIFDSIMFKDVRFNNKLVDVSDFRWDAENNSWLSGPIVKYYYSE